MAQSHAKNSPRTPLTREWILVCLIVGGFLVAWALLDNFQSVRFVIAAAGVLLVVRSITVEQRLGEVEANLREQRESQSQLLNDQTELWNAVVQDSEFSLEIGRWAGELSDRVDALEAGSVAAEGRPKPPVPEMPREDVVRLMEALKASLARKQFRLVPSHVPETSS